MPTMLLISVTSYAVSWVFYAESCGNQGSVVWSGLLPYVYAHFLSSNNGLYSLICIPAWVECPLFLIIKAPAEQNILALNNQFKTLE